MKVKLGDLRIGDFFYIGRYKYIVLFISHKNNKLRCMNVITMQRMWFDFETDAWRKVRDNGKE